MPLMYKYSCLAIVLPLVLFLSGCKDEVEKPVQLNTQNSQSTQNISVSYSHIAPCDEYFSVMQACVNSLRSVEEQQNLRATLTALGQKMQAYNDKGIIEEQCKKAMEEMDLHKKAVGC